MVKIVKPILIAFMNSCEVKKLVCDLLDRYVHTTDNDIDDAIATSVKVALLTNCK